MTKTKQKNLDIENLANITAACFPKLNTEEKQLTLTLYRLLAKGAPVSTRMIAAALSFPLKHIEAYLQTWSGVHFDDEKRVVGFWGLALSEREHHFEVAGTPLYTWCAWDTLFIPQLLGKTAQIQSRCAMSGKVICLSVNPGAISHLSPSDTVISFITPESGKMQENVVRHFCQYVHFFADADVGRHWALKYPGVFLFSIAEAFRLGQRINQIRFGVAL